jgi:hypothetical protein
MYVFINHKDMEPNLQSQKIEILSLDGRIVKVLDHRPGTLLSINNRNLPAGTYILRIQGDQSYVKKVFVE